MLIKNNFVKKKTFVWKHESRLTRRPTSNKCVKSENHNPTKPPAISLPASHSIFKDMSHSLCAKPRKALYKFEDWSEGIFLINHLCSWFAIKSYFLSLINIKLKCKGKYSVYTTWHILCLYPQIQLKIPIHLHILLRDKINTYSYELMIKRIKSLFKL